MKSNMKRNLLLSLFCGMIFLTASCRREVRLYVSPDGSDRNPGTLSQPFAGLRQAQIAAALTPDKAVTVYIRAGVYYLERPIVFTPKDSRRAEAPLTFRAFEGEKVVVSGGVRLSAPTWESYKEGILRAHVPEGIVFDQLFADGQLLPMARYPDYDAGATYYNGVAADAVAPDRVQHWSHPEGGYVHALHRHEWGGYHWKINGKDERNELILEGGYQNNRLMGMHEERRFVENIFEELDAPGEWYVSADHFLYLFPPQGTDITNAALETPQLPHLFEFRGSEAEPVEHIRLEGLELTHTLRTFMDTREPLLRSDWAIYRGGAVVMEGACYCSVVNCFFNTVGGNAVFFSNYNRHNDVSGCHIACAGASGVCFVGDPEAVRSPSFEYNEFVPADRLDREPGAKSNNYPAQCRVFDNLMYGLGRVEKQVAGVHISMSQDIIVAHNTIYDVPRAGINISEGTWGGHLIEHNEVFNTVLETGDHGSFNSWGRDRYWHPRYDTMAAHAAAQPELVLLDAVKTTVIRNNRFRCDHGWDIDLDDGSSNYHICNNVCLNGGIKLREGFHRTVENNIMINNSFHPHVWFPNSGDVFVHNIVSAQYFPIGLNGWGAKVDYNVFPDERTLREAQQNGVDAHSVCGEPGQYVDPLHGDFRVKEGSAALSAGFRNFAMDQFGVLSPALKALAKQVVLPELIDLGGSDTGVQEVLGMRLKSVTTLGERSAAGLSSTSGVWVLEVLPGSVVQGRFQSNDVILRINGHPITDLREMKNALIKSGTRLQVVVFRNQKEETLTVTR
jgi:hypothetical protein